MRSLTVRSTTPCSSDMTGSRLDFWLHALTSAFSDSGYWSGVMTDFSMRQPMTRASFGVSWMSNEVLAVALRVEGFDVMRSARQRRQLTVRVARQKLVELVGERLDVRLVERRRPTRRLARRAQRVHEVAARQVILHVIRRVQRAARIQRERLRGHDLGGQRHVGRDDEVACGQAASMRASATSKPDSTCLASMNADFGTRSAWFATSTVRTRTRSAARNRISLICTGQASASTQTTMAQYARARIRYLARNEPSCSVRSEEPSRYTTDKTTRRKPKDRAVISRPRAAWLEKAVIGLRLCPFAAVPFARDQIRYRVSEQRSPDGLAQELAQELVHLHAADPQLCETSLLIHPHVLTDFADYNQFLGEADAAVAALGLAASCRSRASIRRTSLREARRTTSRTTAIVRLIRCCICFAKRASREP